MKTKVKLINCIGIFATSCAPLMSLASCGRVVYDDEKLANLLTECALVEFAGNINNTTNALQCICDVYRDTYHTKYICDYLKKRVKEIFAETRDQVDIYEDDYIPPESERTVKKDWGHNMYYDIPATNYSMPTVILQGHTDMVWVKSPGYTAENPTPQFNWITKDQKRIQIIQTVQNMSSLGADNGIGLALMLAITKYRNNFEHGKIRILMTTDEEDGDSGAAQLPKEWLYDGEKPIQYFINMDLENVDRTLVSCAGVQQAEWNTTLETTSGESNEEEFFPHSICMKVSGLQGGHSGMDIADGRGNAIVAAFEIMDAFVKYEVSKPFSFQIFKAYEDTTDKVKGGTIPDSFLLYFNSTFSLDEIKSYWNGGMGEIFKNLYNKDPNFHVDFSGVESPSLAIVKNHSIKIMDLIVGQNRLPWSVSRWTDEGTPITSSNIGGVRINDGRISTSPSQFYVNVFGRSSDMDDLGDKPDPIRTETWRGFMAQYKECTRWTFGEGVGEWTPTGWNPPFSKKSKNPLLSKIKEAAEHFEYPLVEYDEMAWCEVAEFSYKTDGEVNLVTLGPTIENAHSVNEYVEVATIPQFTKIVVYTLRTLNDEVNRKEATNE